MSHAYPMIRGGGLFILIMGIGVLLGGFFEGQRRLFLALGGALATAAISVFAGALSRSLGVPTRAQVAALVGAIALEAVLIAIVVSRYRMSGERTLFLAILLAVGIHFLPMAWAFGPICALLSLAACINAGYGLLVDSSVRLKYLWMSDGLLKVLFGGLMLSWGQG